MHNKSFRIGKYQQHFPHSKVSDIIIVLHIKVQILILNDRSLPIFSTNMNLSRELLGKMVALFRPELRAVSK